MVTKVEARDTLRDKHKCLTEKIEALIAHESSEAEELYVEMLKTVEEDLTKICSNIKEFTGKD